MIPEIRRLGIVLAGAAALAVTSVSHAQTIAVWLDGQSSDGGNAIFGRLQALGYTPELVSDAQLETPGFLNSGSFSAIVVSRFGSDFGDFLPASAAANVTSFVGTPGASQGGVALFTNDAADNLLGSSSGDPFDANIDALFVNAVKYAVASGHGYIGEFNGAAQALASNNFGVTPLDLLPGSSDDVHGYGPLFTYGVGPVGSGNPIDAGVTFPFTDSDDTTFLTDVSGANSNNIVDIYTSANIDGEPAVLANSFVINGGQPPMNPVPEPSTYGIMAVAALAGIVLIRRTKLASGTA
jgi:hypothetical protein